MTISGGIVIIPLTANGIYEMSFEHNVMSHPSDRTGQTFWDNKAVPPLTAFLAALITFIVYIPSLKNGFVEWDDQAYVYENSLIRSIDPGFLKRILTTPVNSNWHPLTLFSYAVDYKIWGLNPWGYHLINIIFHAFNAFLVFILVFWLVERAGARKKTFSLLTGLVTALLFGIHPLHVESVAWVSERKDVLSTFFFLLSVFFYVKYASHAPKKALLYSLALISFILALLSKPMAITLPVVLFIIDFYPLERLSLARGLSGIKGLVVEKLPFLALIPVSAALTIRAQGSALASLTNVPVSLRMSIAFRAVIFYLYKMLLPLNLSPYYPYDYNPYPSIKDFLSYEYAGAFALIVLITALFMIILRKNKLFSALWLYYIITLIPVSGIIQVGGQEAADRYTYLPGLGPFMLAGIGAAYLLTRDGKLVKLSCAIVITAAFTALSVFTVRQIAVWKDTISLWTQAIDVYPGQIPVKKYADSVVTIVALDENDQPVALGSGFFINKDGELATNHHVLEKGVKGIIKIPQGEKGEILEIIKDDPDTDMLVATTTLKNTKPIPLGDSDSVVVGEDIIAIGNPKGLQNTVSKGIISGIRTIGVPAPISPDKPWEKYGAQPDTNLFQITAPISPGSSGGPILNSNGKVIGIAAAYLEEGQNLNFALPINYLKTLKSTSLRLGSLPQSIHKGEGH